MPFHARTAITVWRSNGSDDAFAVTYLTRAYAELGQFAHARRCIGEAMTAVKTTRESWCEPEVNIMDWFSRKVLAWRLSNTMDADFCVMALEEAIARFGRPEIFNTEQGSQFTSFAFTNTLKDADIRISMDGRGRWMDNVFIERLWRSLKYECVYLNAFEPAMRQKQGSVVGSATTTRIDPLGLRRQDARRSLCYAGKRGEIGGVIKPRIDLSQAAILSRKRDHLWSRFAPEPFSAFRWDEKRIARLVIAPHQVLAYPACKLQRNARSIRCDRRHSFNMLFHGRGPIL